MNPSVATTPEKDYFLQAMATKYDFMGDTCAVFLSRFHPYNQSKANNVLSNTIQWNRDPANKEVTFADNLKKINACLKTEGCLLADNIEAGQKGIWKIAYKWLWETKFTEWQKIQNQIIPNNQPQKEAVCNFLNQIISNFQDRKLFHLPQLITIKDEYIPIQVTLERKYNHTIETTWSYSESEEEFKRAYALKHSEESKPTQVDWTEAKQEHQRLIVLADPGMGKTTLLRSEAYLTAQTALQGLENNSQKLEDLVIPIFLRLSEIADATQVVTAKVSDAILKLLASKYENHFPQIESFLTDKLKARKCLLLLDALDEVWTQNRQQQNEGRIKAKIRFLEQLAYNFSCAGKEIFSLDELYDQIEKYLQGNTVGTVLRNADTDELITELSEQDGILQKLHKSGDKYLFLHRTFQEYFTACYLQ